MQDWDIDKITNCISIFKNLYDIFRITDPVQKKIIYSGKEEKIDTKSIKSICYNFWKKGSHCDNCVSIRALNENDTFVKIENNKDTIYLLMSCPIKIDGKKYILEILKDITETGIIPDLKGKSQDEINKIIEDINQKIIKDDLTCVYNRRYINERLPVDIYNADVKQQELSVIMLDIDNFKEVNDTYGHIAGDKVLIEIARLLKDSVREDQDWVARYGGDEFLIVLSNADKDITFKISEKLRKSIQQKPIQYDGKKIFVTASFGAYTIKHKMSFSELIKTVDNKLYKAKKLGRNNTVSAE